MEREAVVRHPLFFCVRIAQDPGARLETTHKGDTHNKKSLRIISGSFLRVALERFELSQAEPESDVLPLHHKAIFQFVINSGGHRYDHFVFDVAKVGSFSELCKFFGRKFSKNFIFTNFKPILGRFYLANLFR